MLQKIKDFLFVNTSTRQTVVKNTFWLFSGEIASRLLRFVLVLYAARILGTYGWGTFSYATSIVALFAVFSDLGLNNLITREFAKNSKEKLEYWSTSLVLKLLLIAISSILILMIVPYISRIPELKDILFIFVLIFILDSIREFSFSINRALQKMETESLVKIITNFLIVALGLYALFNSASVKNFSIAYLTGSVIGVLVTLFATRQYFKNVFKNISSRFILPIINFGWPFFVFGALGIIMTNTDIIMLGWWRTAEEIGLYSAAQRIIQFLYIVPSLFSLAIFPVLSKFSNEELKLKTALEKAMAFVLMFQLPIALGGILLAEDIITVTFGEAYVGGSFVLQIFLLWTLITFPMLIANQAVVIKDGHRKVVVYSIIAVTIDIILNYLLIQFGINGVAVATVASTFIATAMGWSIIQKVVSFQVLPHLKRVAVATICMGIFTFLANKININVFINIGLSATVFFCVLYIIKEPLLKEIKLLFVNINRNEI